jgi:Outer membrane efflux protein
MVCFTIIPRRSCDAFGLDIMMVLRRVVIAYMLANIMIFLAACAAVEPVSTLDKYILKQKGDPALVEIDLRMQASRAQALNKIRFLTNVLKIRIEQNVFGEVLVRQARSRVIAGVGRGVDFESAVAYMAESDINLRNAYIDRYQIVQSFREIYGSTDGAEENIDMHVPQSESELMIFVEAGDRTAASKYWLRHQMASGLVRSHDRRVLSLEKIRDAYKQQYEIGQRVLLDLIGVEKEFSEARIGLAQAEAQIRLEEMEFLILTGRFEYIKASRFVQGDGSLDKFDDIEKNILDRANKISVPILLPEAAVSFFTPLPDDPIISFPPTSIGVPSRLETSVDVPENKAGRKVSLVRGHVIILRSDGDIFRLGPGDYIFPSDELVRWPDAEIQYEEGELATGAGLTGGEPGSNRSDNAACAPSIGDKNRLLPRFQWPPWPPTDEYGIDSGARKNLGEIADYLSKALDRVGYENHYAFAAVPGADGASIGGFAIVADPEQILPNGRTVPASGRWQDRLPRAGEVDFLSFIRGLVAAPEGRYRVITFVVTDAPRTRATSSLGSDKDLRAITNCGPMRLTDATVEMRLLRARAVSAKTDIRVLVYEFTKQAEQQPARFLKPGLSAQQHLEQAGIMTALVSRP